MPDVYRVHQLVKPQVTKTRFGWWKVQCVMCLHSRLHHTWPEAYKGALTHANTSPLHRQMLKLKRQLGEFPDEA
jgi:hypothetical protein